MWVLHFLGSATIQLPQIKDCGKINESGLFPRSPPMGVFERINGLGHRANLHSASQRNFALSVLRCEGCSQLFPQWGLSSYRRFNRLCQHNERICG